VASCDLTYPEVGATAGPLPQGYHHVRESRKIGHGQDVFESAASALMSWDMHERAGVHKVIGPSHAVEGAKVTFRWTVMKFECRVVSVIAELDRRGFTYGTLARHPECGEERFVVTFDRKTGVVAIDITAFSKPSSVLVRAVGPVARFVQRWMTRRYLRSFDQVD
jgi:uncharacterized protein (UPF0548 family)